MSGLFHHGGVSLSGYVIDTARDMSLTHPASVVAQAF